MLSISFSRENHIMRIGINPQKGKQFNDDRFIHQVVIPVYIPNDEDYYRDAFRIFKLCIDSLTRTCHQRTFITIVNNGSHDEVRNYIDGLLKEGTIHEVIHTDNVGKVNAILKGVVGHSIELVTIADADVLFLSGWQSATAEIFDAFPKAGVVGLIPQYKAFTYQCENILFDKWFSKDLKFVPVKDPQSLAKYYDSIGWDENRNPHYSELALGIESNGKTAYVGAGHVAATYKRNIFSEVETWFQFKLGGNTLRYIDSLCLHRDYWRLTTYGNFAYHMGNTHESWMDDVKFTADDATTVPTGFPASDKINRASYFLKTRIFAAIFRRYDVRRLFYRMKRLPSHMIPKY